MRLLVSDLEMVFKTITMSELKKSGNGPPSARDSHKEKIGKGNYNRFEILDPRPRTFSTGKRRLSPDDSPVETASKAPKLDSNVLFDKMREHEGKLKDARNALEEVRTSNPDLLKTPEDGLDKCLSQILTVVGLLLSHQEGLSSAVIDCFNSQVSGKREQLSSSQPPSKANLPTASTH